MGDRRRDRGTSSRTGIAGWLVFLAALATSLTMPPAASGGQRTGSVDPGVELLAPPDETCTPGQTFAAGGFDVCAPPAAGTGKGGGINVGGLLPVVLAVLVGAALALVVAYVVLRRRAGPPLDPVDAGEWWPCKNCGSNNVVGSPRCYSCGQWQR